MIHSMALRLVAELRSGYHKQTTEVLHRSDDTKCCLGVASWMVLGDSSTLENNYYIYEDSYQTLRSITMKRFGFFSPEGHRSDNKKIIINNIPYNNLAKANDAGCTFAQIADYIEANWEYL